VDRTTAIYIREIAKEMDAYNIRDNNPITTSFVLSLPLSTNGEKCHKLD